MKPLRTITRSLGLMLGACALLAVSAGAARADEVFIAGFTNGCFGAGCAPGASATVSGLTYSNSTFTGTTANGVRGLGGNPNPGANFNNLGSMSLSTAPNTFNIPFTMQVTFTAPQGINGSNNAVFLAMVTGTVRANDQGGIFIDFDNTPRVFTFADVNCEPDPTGGVPGQQTTCGGGSFNFFVNDLSLDPGQTASVTGMITGAQQTTVPEPATLFLLGTGITGLAAAARRRRQKEKVKRQIEDSEQ